MHTSPASLRERPRFALLAAAFGAVLLVLFAYNVAGTLMLFFVATLFALYLGAITDWLQERAGVSRGLGIALALLLTAVMLTGIIWLIVPAVLEQMEQLISALPGTAAAWQSQLEQTVARYPLVRDLLPAPARLEGYSVAVLTHLGGYFAGILPYLFTGVGAVIHGISVVVMAIYLALRPALYREGVVVLFPPAYRALVRDLLRELTATLRAWIGGQLIAMVILALLTWIGLVALQVPYALAFGVFTGVAVVVPFFGTLVTTLLPALFVLGTGGAAQALLVVMLGVLVHLFEANVVHPMIMQRQVHLPPVLSILSVLIMAELLGAFGLLIAVPVLASVMLVIRRVWVERILGAGSAAPELLPDAAAAHATEGAEPAVPGGVALAGG
jgi:predicted PurR-regulated permease PerM